VLLGGAVFLESYAILLMVISPWTYADLQLGWSVDCEFDESILL